MPQEHHVLRCFSCETFQVHIVKKTNKWDCKLCGAKQTVKRNYGKGSGKDCRNQVMKLNELRLSADNSSKLMKDDDMLEKSFSEEFNEPEFGDSGKEPGKEKPFQSKWVEYLEEQTPPSGGSDTEGNTESFSEMVLTKKKRTKKQSKRSQNCSKKICRKVKTSDEVSSRAFVELNPSFLIDETFESDDNKTPCKTVTLKNNYKQHPAERKNALKHSKYAKYLDDDDDSNSTQVNKTSNIFNSDISNLDNILNF